MTSIKKIFEIVESNNYTELEKIIKNNKTDLSLKSRKNEYLIPQSVKYRAKECFDLLIETKYLNINDSRENGLWQALCYYCISKNEGNYYYIEKLKQKNINFDLDDINKILENNCLEDFKEVVINYINNNQEDYVEIINYKHYNNTCNFFLIEHGIKNNLINNENINDIIINKDNFSILINKGINIFISSEYTNTVLLDNFNDQNTISMLVDSIIKFDVNYDFTKLLINYINLDHCNYYNWHNFFNLSFKAQLYNIYKNFETLKKLNCVFSDGEIIINMIINSIIEIKSFDDNYLLLITNIVDLFFENNIINKNLVLKNIITNKLESIQFLQYFLKHLQSKEIDISNYDKIMQTIIPENIKYDYKPPKKVKPIK
jgi:hypothetical protein